ncbi:MAG: mechanosensitive ion channel family protein [Clostridia bacterium]|nr:mechanosensitive ion channel family protein [Clostridia bacterium]
MEKFLEHLTNLGLGAFAPVVGTLIVLIIGLLLVKTLVKIAAKAFEKNDKLDPSVEKLLLVIVRVGGCAVLALICAEMLSIPTTSLITLLGTFGLAFSLSLQSTVENIASGIFIMASKPFLTGHWISAGGSEGTVIRIGLTHTELKTATNQKICIPNGKLAGETVVNYSVENTRRLDLTIPVAYDTDTDKAKKVLAQVVAVDERILTDTAPFIRVWDFDSSSVNIVVRVWTECSDYWELRSSLIEKIKVAFEENDITIPYNTVTVISK